MQTKNLGVDTLVFTTAERVAGWRGQNEGLRTLRTRTYPAVPLAPVLQPQIGRAALQLSQARCSPKAERDDGSTTMLLTRRAACVARQHHLASLRAVAPPHARWRGLATARTSKSGATPSPARKANWASDEVRRLAEGGDVAKALDRAKASRVDRRAWFSVLKALNRRATTHPIRGSRIPRMARLALTEMARQRMQPESRDVTAAINACVAAGAPSDGLDLFRRFGQDGDTRLRNAALRAANAAEDFDEGAIILEGVDAWDDWTYAYAAQRLAKRGDVDAVRRLVDTAKGEDGAAREVLRNALVRAHANCGDVDGAVEAASTLFPGALPARTRSVLSSLLSGSSAAGDAHLGEEDVETDDVLDARRMTVPDARRAVLLALRRRGEAAFAGAALEPLVVRCGAPRVHSPPRRWRHKLKDRGALRRGVEDLLGDLGLAFVGGGVGVVRVEVEALDAYFEALALRQTRDSLIRASLVRHAALPGGALLAMLVAPKLLPFV